MKRTLFLLTLVGLICCNSQRLRAQESLEVKNVIRAGIEFRDYLTNKSGSFTKVPGYTTGFMTGISLYRLSGSAIILGIDGGYTNIIDYYSGISHEYLGYDHLYRSIYDERYQVRFVELGLQPGYFHSLGHDVIGSFYAGASFGIGIRTLEVKQLSSTVIDPTVPGNPVSMGPYGEETGNHMTSVGCFNMGIGLYYKLLMVDLRYKSTNVGDTRKYNNYYLQVGIVL